MTEKPTIELRKIKVHVGLSQETPAYTAIVHVDGRPFAEVSNSGHGGPDMYHAINGSQKDVWAEVEVLNERIKATYPKVEACGMELDQSLEMLCHDLVWEHVDQRNFRSKLSRTILMIEDGKTYALKGKPTADAVAAAAKRFPKATILNALPFNKAWEVAKGTMKQA